MLVDSIITASEHVCFLEFPEHLFLFIPRKSL